MWSYTSVTIRHRVMGFKYTNLRLTWDKSLQLYVSLYYYFFSIITREVKTLIRSEMLCWQIKLLRS